MMMSKQLHMSDEQLLQLIDGELPVRDMAGVERHLAECVQCDERRNEIALVLNDIQQVRSEAAKEFPVEAGPRALLKTRMAQLRSSKIRPRIFGSLAYAALLALTITAGTMFVHRWSVAREMASSEPLPDRAITPGVTRQVSLTELCSVDRDETIRNVSSKLQNQVFREYGIDGKSTADFEVDYLITPGLGGSDDVRNLWPEPHSNTLWNSYVKDQLEDHLHHLVCGGKLRLKEAQGDIASDWISAYKKYFHTEQPLTVGQSASFAKIR